MEETTYNFVTNRITAYPAKSPMGMFESRLIPNDLVIVLEAREKYYG